MNVRWLNPDVRRLLTLLHPWRGWMALGVLLAVVAALSAVGLMAVSGWFIAAMALAGASGAIINYYTPAAAIRGFAITRTGGRYGERLATHDATLRALSGLRAWLFRRLIPLAPARLSALRSAELFARLRADVDALEQFYLAVLVPLVVAATAVLAVTLLVMLVLPDFTPLFALAVVVAGVVLPLWVRHRTGFDAAAAVHESAELRGLLMDALRGHAELLAWGRTQAYAGRIAALDSRLAARRRRIERLEASTGKGVALAAQLAVPVLLALGLPAVHAGRLAPPPLVMLALTVLAAFELIGPLPAALAQWVTARTAARRVFELVDTPPAIREPAAPTQIPATPEVQFDGAWLRYGDDRPWALAGADLVLAPGARLAIVGASGVGKSSLLHALQKFYPLQHGRILLGGLPLQSLQGDDVRRTMAVIAQRVTLFNRSLRENLLLAAPASTPAQISQALHAAQLDPFVASLPAGLDTPLGEGGTLVSGGEARRIAIARALLQDAPILVLDEPTEGLDAATAAQLYDALYTATRGRSVLLVTHRLGHLAALVDEVAVMEGGHIVQRMATRSYLQKTGRGPVSLLPESCFP